MAELTPAYYPVGWNRERMLNCCLDTETEDLTDGQKIVFREGLMADLGQEGFDMFYEEMFRRDMEASGTTIPKVVHEPPFMQGLRDGEWFGWSPGGPWGFVVFKSPEIVDDARWAVCKERFMKIVHDSIDDCRPYDGVDECVSRMAFQIYNSLTPPDGLRHKLCLYITPASVDSILNYMLPSIKKRRYRVKIPFVVALFTHDTTQDLGQGEVQEDEGEDPDEVNWNGVFNVAVEALVDTLFPILASDRCSAWEIGGRTSGDDVWCDEGRWGVHKAGVGYYDMRTRQAGDGM